MIGVMRGSTTISLPPRSRHLPEVVRRDRRALGRVRAGDQHDLGLGEVGPGIRGAVDAERQLVGGAGRDHAEPAVVVDVLRAERDARELAEHVRLLGDHRGAAVDGDRRPGRTSR